MQEPDGGGEAGLQVGAQGFAIGEGGGGEAGEGATELAVFGFGEGVEGQEFQGSGRQGLEAGEEGVALAG